MRTNNPIFSQKMFANAASELRGGAMTVQGTVTKTGILLLCALLPAAYTWQMATSNMAAVQGFMMVGLIGGLIAALATAFRPMWAPITAPIYAALEGLLLGGISAIFEASYPGIAIQAVGLTFGTLAALLLAYKAGMIQVTERFRTGIIAATGGIALFYFIAMLLSFFGVGVPYVFGSGLVGIGFSLFVVAIAALNLVLDFDFIENAERQGLPKAMEWYGAFGVMVTLVWLYLEMLRLLSKLRDNR